MPENLDYKVAKTAMPPSPAEAGKDHFSGGEQDLIKVLRDSESRLRFLMLLEENTRNLDRADQIMAVCTRMTAKYLGTSRSAYSDVAEDGDTFSIRADYAAEGVASSAGQYRLSRFGRKVVQDLHSNHTLVIRDVDAEIAANEGGTMFNAIGVKAIISCPLVKEGRLHAMMSVHQNTPRNWTPEEIKLIEAVAEHCWSYIERVRYQDRVSESEERFRQLANAMPQMVWTARPDGLVDYYNQRWYDYTGLPQDSIGNEGWKEILSSEDLNVITAAWARHIAEGTPYECQFRIKNRATGEYRWHLSRAAPARDAKGNIVKWFGTNTDIEDQKRAETQLILARRAAEAANLAKSEFLAQVSHEIRTPMNAIMGLSSLLERAGPLTDKQRSFVQTLKTSANAMMTLINDLLDISRIEARTIELEKIPFDICQIINEVATMLATAIADKKKLKLVVDTDGLEKCFYVGDSSRLRQIILNLCSNAVKFTDKGEIRVIARHAETDKPHLRTLSVMVQDTGIGIAPEKIGRIFEKFMQGDASINRRFGGSGLGLAISKGLAEMMGGEILVESTPGKGSIFTLRITLPVASDHADADLPAAAQEDIAPEAKVLVVEDYQPNLLAAAALLEDLGYSYDVAKSGSEAVEKIKEADYPVIMMDVQMPGMSGLEATKIIRAYERLMNKPHARIIGVTAYAIKGDRELCLEAGMDDYLTKPFTPAALKDKMAEVAAI